MFLPEDIIIVNSYVATNIVSVYVKQKQGKGKIDKPMINMTCLSHLSQ